MPNSKRKEVSEVSRKDFIAIAASVRESVSTDDDRKKLADQLANYFASVNPRFDRNRFFAACGL